MTDIEKATPTVDVDSNVAPNSEASSSKETTLPTTSTNKSSSKNKKKKKKPSNIKDIELFYPDKKYPEGLWMEYEQDFNFARVTDEEKRYIARDLENGAPERWNDMRKGAEIHRRVRKNLMSKLNPGMTLTEIVNMVEDATRKFTNTSDATRQHLDYKKQGIAFPTGVSLNNIAAHFTPNKGDTTVLKYDDVMKVDFGVHVNGHIIDSAWTVVFNKDKEYNKYEPLMTAVKEATNTGIKEAGIDVRLTDIGEAIQEVMESYEVELDGKTYPVKCCRNLCGHNITPYKIHGGKSVPIVKNGDETKMEEGEHFAIETFGTTGRGYVVQEGESSHYALSDEYSSFKTKPGLERGIELLKSINDNFGTLPWCKRYLDRLGHDNYYPTLDYLVRQGYVQDYPPLVDIPGSYTAQYEHTILLHPHKKEVVSKGEDY